MDWLTIPERINKFHWDEGDELLYALATQASIDFFERETC